MQDYLYIASEKYTSDVAINSLIENWRYAVVRIC